MIDFLMLFVIFSGIAFAVIYIALNFQNIAKNADEWWNGVKKPKTIIMKGIQQAVLDDQNNPVMETVKEGRKKDVQWSKIIGHLILMILIPFFLISIIKKLDVLGNSIVIGISFAIIIAITSKKRDFIGKGIIYGIIIGFISFWFPAIFIGTLLLAAWVFLIIGNANFILEEISGANIFPHYTLAFCGLFVFINILQATVDGIAGHHIYVSFVLNWLINTAGNESKLLAILNYAANSINDYFPFTQHIISEGSRVWLIIVQLLEALQWIVVGFIILLISIPGEFMNWIDNVHIATGLKELVYSLFGILGIKKVVKKP